MANYTNSFCSGDDITILRLQMLYLHYCVEIWGNISNTANINPLYTEYSNTNSK